LSLTYEDIPQDLGRTSNPKLTTEPTHLPEPTLVENRENMELAQLSTKYDDYAKTCNKGHLFKV